MTIRIRRSELATPASNWNMIEKAAASEAPTSFSSTSRMRSRPPRRSNRGPTLFAGSTNSTGVAPFGRFACNDIALRVGAQMTFAKWSRPPVANLDILIVPKVKEPPETSGSSTPCCTQLEKKLEASPQRIGIEILIEETEALARVEEIAACCPRLEALILGVGDLSASQGIRFAQVSVIPRTRATPATFGTTPAIA